MNIQFLNRDDLVSFLQEFLRLEAGLAFEIAADGKVFSIDCPDDAMFWALAKAHGAVIPGGPSVAAAAPTEPLPRPRGPEAPTGLESARADLTALQYAWAYRYSILQARAADPAYCTSCCTSHTASACPPSHDPAFICARPTAGY